MSNEAQAIVEKANAEVASLTPRGHVTQGDLDAFEEEVKRRVPGSAAQIEANKRREAGVLLWHAAQDARYFRAVSAVLFEASATLAVARDDAEARALLNRDAGVLGDLGWVPPELVPTVRKALDVLAPWTVPGTLSAAATAAIGTGVSD